MELGINTINTNASYQYSKAKNSTNKGTSFADQLNESKNSISLDNTNRTSTTYSNSGRLNKSTAEIERESEINKIQNSYDEAKKEIAKNGNISGWNARLDTETMKKVLNLQIANNKDAYFTNGEVNINKVAKDCNISFDNATPLELESLRRELTYEGLIDEKKSDILDSFISRIVDDTVLNTKCSYSDAYNNIRVNVKKEALHFKDLDSTPGLDSDNSKIDDIILGIFE
jgi:hypothetical protein